MEKINYDKTFKINEESFRIKFVGLDTNNSNNIKRLIPYQKSRKYKDMKKNIAIIRHILKDYQESILLISYHCPIYAETIKYSEKKLVYYEKVVFDKIIYSIKYNDSNISFSFKDKDNNILDFQSLIEIKNNINSFIEYIDSLNDIELDISNDTNYLIELYKAFFEEEPDFYYEECHSKMQCMIFLLSLFGIINNEYKFVIKESYPNSQELKNKIDYLYPLNNLKPKETIDIKLEKRINLIGKLIKTHINKENFTNDLMKLCKVLYIKEYYLDKVTSIQILKDFSELNESEVKQNLKLIKMLNTKLKKPI